MRLPTRLLIRRPLGKAGGAIGEPLLGGLPSGAVRRLSFQLARELDITDGTAVVKLNGETIEAAWKLGGNASQGIACSANATSTFDTSACTRSNEAV